MPAKVKQKGIDRSKSSSSKFIQLDGEQGSFAAIQGELAVLKRENAILRTALNTLQVAPALKDADADNQRYDNLSCGPSIARSFIDTSMTMVRYNDLMDTKYAHKAEDFGRILHIFHQEWLGIRAAAGSLPGQKIAVSASGSLTRTDIKAFFTFIDVSGAERFVFHGMSENAAMLIQYLAKAGLSNQVYLVYHGNVSQWCYEPERRMAIRAIEIVRRGYAKRIHFLKKGHDMVEGSSFKPMLLNMTPVVNCQNLGSTHIEGQILVPGADDWRKNLHCNALGAAMNKHVSSVIHYTKNIQLAQPYLKKLKHTKFVDRSSTLQLMAMCMYTMNVSLVDCHPMVNLESEAVGTPCLRGPLNFDTLEDHPYVRAMNISDPTNPFEISEGIDKIVAIPKKELQEMLSGYVDSVNLISLARYREFLEMK